MSSSDAEPAPGPGRDPSSRSPAPETVDAETGDVVLTSSSGLRQTTGLLGWFVFAAGIVIALAHLYANTYGLYAELTRNALHFAAFGVLCALLYPLARPRSRGAQRIVFAIDIGLAVLLCACIVYVLMRERALSGRSFTLWLDYAVFLVVIALAIDFTRRTTGWIIPVLLLLSVTYVLRDGWGSWLSGPIAFGGLSLETVLQRSIYGEEGLFGTIASISTRFVFMFILFGAFLIKSGAGEFIIDLARAAAGRMVGGPGFVAVFGSALTGTISGSAVANTVSTGVITIPLMKKSGFPPRFAAGVEAAASTGGQLMPPIMGAGAFVMANLTEISYLTIIAVALLPALLYFWGIACNVRIIAKREGLQAETDTSKSVWSILRARGAAFLIPLAVLVGMLISGFTPPFAAAFGILAVIASSWLTPNRMGPRAILEAMELGARTMILTAILLVSVGLIVMAITTSGLGNTMSLMIVSWAGGNLFIAIVLIAIASLILGMGLPVTASYIVLATLAAPALQGLILQPELLSTLVGSVAPADVSTIFLLFPTAEILAPIAHSAGVSIPMEQLQGLITTVQGQQPLSREQAEVLIALSAVPEISQILGNLSTTILPAAMVTTALLSAHMIIYWLSQDSNVTPPVCLTAFAAAAIAGTKPMPTGFTAWKVSKTLYIVPLLFAYTPFLSGDWVIAIEITLFGALGIYALIAAIEGHAERPVPWVLRPILFGVGVALIWPSALLINAAGAVVLVGFMALNLRGRGIAVRQA